MASKLRCHRFKLEMAQATSHQRLHLHAGNLTTTFSNTAAIIITDMAIRHSLPVQHQRQQRRAGVVIKATVTLTNLSHGSLLMLMRCVGAERTGYFAHVARGDHRPLAPVIFTLTLMMRRPLVDQYGSHCFRHQQTDGYPPIDTLSLNR